MAQNPQDLLGSFGDVKFSKRTPDLVLGRYVVSLVDIAWQESDQGPGTPKNVAIMTKVLIDGREAEGPHGIYAQISGVRYPSYTARDLKEITAAVLGLVRTDPRALKLDNPDLYEIMNNPAKYKGRKFVVSVTKGGWSQPDKHGNTRRYVKVDPFALEAGQTFDVPTTTEEDTQADDGTKPASVARAAAPSPAAMQAARKPVAPPLPAAPVNDGGPWFDFDAPDPRSGVEQYNERGETRAKV